MLNQMQIGSHATVTHISGGKPMLRKLMSLGIKTGSEIEMLHHRSKGIVVRSMGTRIALGQSIAQHIEIRPKLSHQIIT
jgi:ferrous iron transport protein A